MSCHPRSVTATVLFMLLFLQVAAITYMLPSAHATSTEQITNGGFETGDFAGWVAFGCSRCSITSPGYSGTYAANATAKNYDDASFSQAPLEAPTYIISISLSLALRANVNDSHGLIDIEVHLWNIAHTTYSLEYIFSEQSGIPLSNSTHAGQFDLRTHPTGTWIVITRNIYTDAIAVFGPSFWAIPIGFNGLFVDVSGNGDSSPVTALLDDFSVMVDHLQYPLAVSVNPPEAGNTNPSGTALYDADSQVSVTATANPGYEFVNWILDDNPAGSANPILVTMNSPHNLTASFIAADPTTVTVVDAYRGAILSWTPIADVDEWHLYGHGPNNASWELLATVPGANTTWRGPLPPDMWRTESDIMGFTLYYRVVPAANGTELSELAGEISDENVPSARISCWINSYTTTRDLIEIRVDVQNWSLNATSTGIVIAEITPVAPSGLLILPPLTIHRTPLRSLPGYQSADEYFVDYAPSNGIAPGDYAISAFVWSCLPSESGVWETSGGMWQIVTVT